MVENNKIFTNNDILNTLLKMTPENKEALLMTEFGILRNIVNNTESAQIAIENCDKYIAGWQRAKEAIIELLDKIE